MPTADARSIGPSKIRTEIALYLIIGSIARLAESSIEEEPNTESANSLVGIETIYAGLVVEVGIIGASSTKGDIIGYLANSASCTYLQEVIGAETSAIC